jgi:hypothetical protein
MLLSAIKMHCRGDAGIKYMYYRSAHVIILRGVPDADPDIQQMVTNG